MGGPCSSGLFAAELRRKARRVKDIDTNMLIQVTTLSQATGFRGLSRSMMTDATTNAALRGTMTLNRRSHTAVVVIDGSTNWLSDG